MSLEQFIKPNLRESRESETLLINQTSLALQANNHTVYKMGFGQSPFPVPRHVVDSLRLNAEQKEYMSVQGDISLRRAIANCHRKFQNKNWHEDDIVIGIGSKILLYCVMAAFKHADVIIPAPSWVSYEPQAELAGHNIHWLATSFESKWKINAEQIEQLFADNREPTKPAILVLNYPSNPTGQTYTDAELASLATVLKKHNVIVIADEIYALLSFGRPHHSIEDFYPEGVITTSGLSKWGGAGGWRMGFLHVPKQLASLKERIIGVASETYSCAASPIQLAATEAYSETDLATVFLQQQNHALSHIATICHRKLADVGIRVHLAQGGFYLFPDFTAFESKLIERGILSSQDLVKRILEDTGVALLPGSAFGMPSHSYTARLAFVDFDGTAIVKDGLQDSSVSHLIEGIDKLCHWCHSL